MSQAEATAAGTTATAASDASPVRKRIWTLGLFRSELVTTFRRWRTIALLAVLAGVPILVGIAVKIETSGGSPAAGGGGADPRSSRRSPTTACSWSSRRSPRRSRSSCRWPSG